MLHVATFNVTYTLGGTTLDEGLALRRRLYLTTRDIHKRQISMLPVVIEPTFLQARGLSSTP